MPDSVEITAPVSTTTDRASRSQRAVAGRPVASGAAIGGSVAALRSAMSRCSGGGGGVGQGDGDGAFELLPGPGRRLPGQGRVEPGRAEDVLGLGSAVAHAEEDERHPAGVAAGGGQGGGGGGGGGPRGRAPLVGRGGGAPAAPGCWGGLPGGGPGRPPPPGR